MVWEVEYTDEFGDWWTDLMEVQQDRIAATVQLLAEHGLALPFPIVGHQRVASRAHAGTAGASGGNPLRILYAFDPRRAAILLIGGDKTGRDRFYEDHVPSADDLYDAHIRELQAEGLL